MKTTKVLFLCSTILTHTIPGFAIEGDKFRTPKSVSLAQRDSGRERAQNWNDSTHPLYKNNKNPSPLAFCDTYYPNYESPKLQQRKENMHSNLMELDEPESPERKRRCDFTNSSDLFDNHKKQRINDLNDQAQNSVSSRHQQRKENMHSNLMELEEPKSLERMKPYNVTNGSDLFDNHKKQRIDDLNDQANDINLLSLFSTNPKNMKAQVFLNS